MKILIVDDEKPARDRLSRMVGELKEHELVGEAVNGLEALGMAQSDRASLPTTLCHDTMRRSVASPADHTNAGSRQRPQTTNDSNETHPV